MLTWRHKVLIAVAALAAAIAIMSGVEWMMRQTPPDPEYVPVTDEDENAPFS